MSRITCRDNDSAERGMDNSNNKNDSWTFFSNHTHVLVCLTHTPQPTMRQMAIQVGITERAVQRILAKLIAAGVVSVKKKGRQNRYKIDYDQQLRHPLETHKTIGEFIRLIDNEHPVDR